MVVTVVTVVTESLLCRVLSGIIARGYQLIVLQTYARSWLEIVCRSFLGSFKILEVVGRIRNSKITTLSFEFSLVPVPV